jgi:MFS family permease
VDSGFSHGDKVPGYLRSVQMKIPKFCQPYVKDPLLIYEQRCEQKLSPHAFITYVSCILSLSAWCIGYLIAHSQQIVDHLLLFHEIPMNWQQTVDSIVHILPNNNNQQPAEQTSPQIKLIYDQQYEENIAYFYFSLYLGLSMGSLLSFLPCDMSGRKRTLLYSIVSTLVLLLVYIILLSEEAVTHGNLNTIRFLLGSAQGFLFISSVLYVVEVSLFCTVSLIYHIIRFISHIFWPFRSQLYIIEVKI